MSIFSQIGTKKFPSNSFDLSHDFTFTAKGGYLYPILSDEILPGDIVNLDNVILARLMPMLAPVMHKCSITATHHFVPLRLLWDGYEEFFAEPVPDENTPVAPYFADFEVHPGDLSNFIGIPTKTFMDDNGILRTQYSKITKSLAYYHAAYNKIYNDWYRDQNLVNNGEPYPDKLVDGLNDYNKFNKLHRRAWQHDYYSACLPFAQKGEAIEIPIAAFDDVPVYTSQANYITDPHATFTTAPWFTAPDDSAYIDQKLNTGETDSGRIYAETSQLSNASTITINALRWANKLQEFLERNARGGTRYIELIRSHFGVISSDARQQRAEFLGWSQTPIVMSEVLSTANTSQVDTQGGNEVIGAVGDMYGHGIGVGRTKHTRYRAEEHGIFMTILSIRPKTSYSQGLHRKFTRFTSLDYPWPEFAHLGEQEVKNYEVYYDDRDGFNDETFGYMQRYAEAKYSNDRFAGDMTHSLNYWHMGRIFTSRPLLNQSFIECNPTTRIFNYTGGDSYIIHVTHNYKIRRILPKQGIPSL